MNEPESARSPRLDLGALQRWMHEVITHPHGIAEGVAADLAQREIPLAAGEIEQVILPSQKLDSLARLAVYGNAYYARLLECLESVFPALRVTLGEEGFASFGFAYLQRFPSQSYTLDHLADRFAEFLETTRSEFSSDVDGDEGPPAEDRPDADADEATELAEGAADEPGWPEFLIDLARLELAIEKVFDGPGSEGAPHLSAERIAEIPAERFAQVRLVPTPSLHLLALRFPLHDYYTAARNESEPPEIPLPAPFYTALWRREFVVRRLPLSHEQYLLLEGLLAGLPLGEAIAAAADTADDFSAFAANLRDWFRAWTSAGFFIGVDEALVGQVSNLS